MDRKGKPRDIRFTNSAGEVVESTEMLTDVLNFYAEGVGMLIER